MLQGVCTDAESGGCQVEASQSVTLLTVLGDGISLQITDVIICVVIHRQNGGRDPHLIITNRYVRIQAPYRSDGTSETMQTALSLPLLHPGWFKKPDINKMEKRAEGRIAGPDLFYPAHALLNGYHSVVYSTQTSAV